MTGPIDPPRRIQNTRRQRRRADDPMPHDLAQGEAPTIPNLPVVTAEPPKEERRAERRKGPSASALNAAEASLSAFAAHMIGQEHRRRGLRGGQPVLDEARSRYLGAEYSGPADRRPKPGRITKTDI